MQKIVLLAGFLWMSVLPFSSTPEAGEIDLDIKAFVCSEGIYFIRFGVMNHYTYDCNPTIAFKIIKDGTPVACKRVTLQVPAGADGSRDHDFFIETICSEREEVTLESRIFRRDHRNKVGPWLGDCP